MNLLPIVATLVCASALLVHGIRRLSERLAIFDMPNHRSSHVRPTPIGGGLAIVAICVIGLNVYWFLRPGFPARTLASYTLAGTLIAVVSWIDDVRGLSSRTRFAIQGVAAIIVLAGCGYWDVVAVPGVGSLRLGWLGLPITFLWIVGLTNAYNFMDGIDGIAGTQAVVGGLGWLALGTATGQPLPCTLGLLLAAASLGFLIHNYPPARIFMGDVGSAFLGFTFAFLSVATSQTEPKLALAGILVVWPFVFDSLSTFLRRLWQGEDVLSAHRTHFYQRMVAGGWKHGSVTLLYTGLAVAGSLAAVVFVGRPAQSDWTIAFSVAVMAAGLWIWLRRRESTHVAVPTDAEPVTLPIGAVVALREGRHVTLVASQPMLATALLAADALGYAGFNAGVLGAPSGELSDIAALIDAARDTRLLVTIEEEGAGNRLGAAVPALLAQAKIPNVRCHKISMPLAPGEIPPADSRSVIAQLMRVLKHDFHAHQEIPEPAAFDGHEESSQKEQLPL